MSNIGLFSTPYLVATDLSLNGNLTLNGTITSKGKVRFIGKASTTQTAIWNQYNQIQRLDGILTVSSYRLLSTLFSYFFGVNQFDDGLRVYLTDVIASSGYKLTEYNSIHWIKNRDNFLLATTLA